MVRGLLRDTRSETPVIPQPGTDYDEDEGGYLERRAKRKAQKKEEERQLKEEYVRAKKHGYKTAREERAEAQERILELKKKERSLKQQEREYEHPIRTRAIRRAEKLIERNLSEGERALQRAPRQAGRTLQRVVRIQRPVRIRSGFTEGTGGGRTRLPVFAPQQASFAERIAMDFGARPPSEILQTKQPIELFSNKADMLFGENKQIDFGIGTNNKKKIRLF